MVIDKSVQKEYINKCETYWYGWKKGMNLALQRIKLLREKNMYTIQYLSECLGIDKNTYLQFEQGKCKKELSYYILIKLSRLYNVSIDYIIGTEESPGGINSPEIRNDIADFAVLDAEQRELFLKSIKNIGHISEQSFEVISRDHAVAKYIYTDEDQKKKSVVLKVCAPKIGDMCFIVAKGNPGLAVLEGDSEGEYFQINGKKHYLYCGDLKILCTICARIDG